MHAGIKWHDRNQDRGRHHHAAVSWADPVPERSACYLCRPKAVGPTFESCRKRRPGRWCLQTNLDPLQRARRLRSFFQSAPKLCSKCTIFICIFLMKFSCQLWSSIGVRLCSGKTHIAYLLDLGSCRVIVLSPIVTSLQDARRIQLVGQSYGGRKLAVYHLPFVNRIGCNLAALFDFGGSNLPYSPMTSPVVIASLGGYVFTIVSYATI